jgi:sarcosine dehydrogenase
MYTIIIIIINLSQCTNGPANVGEDPRLHGMYHNCGYNSSGMMLAGGCAVQIAQWIVNGRPDLHMFSYDIR